MKPKIFLCGSHHSFAMINKEKRNNALKKTATKTKDIAEIKDSKILNLNKLTNSENIL